MGGRKKGKITIRKALENRDETLFHNIESIWDKARELQERQQSKEGHQQGSLHCETVEDNLGKLISDEEKEEFSPIELFLLSAAACYHDAGKSDDFEERHAMVAMKDIFKNPEKYHLTDPQAKVLSFIVGAHDEDDVFDEVPEIYPIGNEDVRVRSISALFRLADVLHTDNSRIPHIKVDAAKEEGDKTRFRKLVQGWSFKNESHIIFKAAPENIDDVNIIAKGISMMQKQIECIAPVLRSEGYPYEIVYSCDNRGIIWEAEKESERKILEMDYYTENEAKIFKGRKVESDKLLKKVVGSNVSLLIGNSGVGKTSLIQAGLFPKLKKMGWKCIWTRPINPDPLDRILNDINVNIPEGHKSNDLFSSIKELSRQSEYDVVLAIDQFEDILWSPPPVKEAIGNMLLSIYGKSFRNVHVLLSYRGDYEAKINSFLENSGVTSPGRFPLLELESSGAKEALRCIFQTNNVGIPDELLERIIEELEKNSEGLYPPFIQIVASSLINLAEANGGNITEELFNNEALSVEAIIGNYLLKRLDELGKPASVTRKNAEAILKELVRDRAKEQKGKDELSRYLDISSDELQELLNKMVDKRLIRHLGSNNYEIIHDFLALSVEEGMIKDDERPLRRAKETLRTKTSSYEYFYSLLDTNELVSIYSMKEDINPSIKEKELLMYSYLAGNGPAWCWFKDDSDVLRTFIVKGLSNRYEKVRRGALSAYEKLGTHEDLQTVKKMLKDPEWYVKEAALSAYEKLGTHEDISAVKEMLKEPHGGVKTAALSAYEKLGTHEDLPVIKEMLEDPEWYVKTAALSAFEKLGTHEDLPAIKEMLEDPNSSVKEAALSAYGKLGHHDDLQAVKEMLKEPHGGVKRAAKSAFVKLVTHEDLPTVIEMLKNPWEIENEALSAYKKLVTHEDLPAIKEMLEDPNSSVKEAALSAFEKLGTHEDLHIITGMLKDPEWFVKTAALSAFEKLGTHEDLHLITGMLMDNDKDVRRVALLAYEKLGTHEDLPAIKEMLKDPNSNVKSLALLAYEKLGRHEDLLAIKEMFKDPYSDMRIEALSAYVKLGTHEDIPAFKEMLKDPDLYVRFYASNFIVEFGDEQDLQEIAKTYAKGDIFNEESLQCIISLDEKLYSPKKELLSLHPKDDWY